MADSNAKPNHPPGSEPDHAAHPPDHCGHHGDQENGGQQEKSPCCSGHEEGQGEAPRRSHHSDKLKSGLTSRLNRIEGQIRGVKGMIEKDVYCDDVLNQIAAIQSALNSVGKLLLEGHMKSCVVERIMEGDQDVLDELLITVNKLMR